jgi:DHA1 family multidrug resistance protein-like MFS transporter
MLRRIFDRSSDYLALDKILRVLIATNIVTSFGDNLYGSLLGIYITYNLGVSILVYGLMNAVQGLVSSLAIFPSGALSDNFGRKIMAILAVIFSISTLSLLFFAKDLPLLFLTLIVQGLSSSFGDPSRSAYVVDVIKKERRGIAFATLAFFQSLSSIVATAIAGIIAGIYGYYWLFFASLILELIALCGMLFYLKESLHYLSDAVKERPLNEPTHEKLRTGLAILKSPPLLAVLFGVVLHMLGLGIEGPYLTIYAKNVLAFSLPSISLVLSAQQIGIFIGHLPSGKIVDKYGGEISFAFHILATSPSMFLFTVAWNPILASIVLFFWGLTFGLDNVSRQSLIAKYRLRAGVATAFGVISLISGITSLVSPMIGGWIWTEFSPQTVFYASAAINALGSMPLFMLWSHNRKTT